MLSSGTPKREHKISDGSNDNGAQFSFQDQHFSQFNTPTNRPNMSSSHSAGSAFSLGALDPQDNPQQQQLARQNHCLLHSETGSPNSVPRPREGGESVSPSGYENYQQGFPLSTGHGFNPSYGAQDSFEAFAKSDISEPSALSVTSPEALLSTLSVIQQKTQQLQAVVQLMTHGGGKPTMPHQQQALAAGIASVISQLVLASAGLLHQSSAPLDQVFASNPQLGSILGGALTSGSHIFQQSGMGNSLGGALGNPMESALESFYAPDRGCSQTVGMGTGSTMRGGIGEIGNSGFRDRNLGGQALVSSAGSPGSSLVPSIGNIFNNTHDIDVVAKGTSGSALGAGCNHLMDTVAHQLMHHGTGISLPPSGDQDSGLGWRDDDDGEAENLPPGSYDLVEMDAAEILAEHTHFCEICGKGFKRDANLRMHMRGHGDEYKTPAALARPDKSVHDPSAIRPRRYSCPFVGCKRNKKHRKFQPLKTMLCVKNHYRRSHCPKMLICNKCKTKKFSVVADLKTHEKHCGRDKWQCSCGTTFSRKDKLFGHIGLFSGHTPALPLHEMENSVGALDSMPSCYSSGNGEHLESLSCNESAVLLGAGGPNNFLHGINAALMAGSVRAMDMGEGLQALGQRASCPSISEDSSRGLLGDDSSPPCLGSSVVSNSSMLHGLLSSSFLNQADGST